MSGELKIAPPPESLEAPYSWVSGPPGTSVLSPSLHWSNGEIFIILYSYYNIYPLIMVDIYLPKKII